MSKTDEARRVLEELDRQGRERKSDLATADAALRAFMGLPPVRGSLAKAETTIGENQNQDDPIGETDVDVHMGERPPLVPSDPPEVEKIKVKRPVPPEIRAAAQAMRRLSSGNLSKVPKEVRIAISKKGGLAKAEKYRKLHPNYIPPHMHHTVSSLRALDYINVHNEMTVKYHPWRYPFSGRREFDGAMRLVELGLAVKIHDSVNPRNYTRTLIIRRKNFGNKRPGLVRHDETLPEVETKEEDKP